MDTQQVRTLWMEDGREAEERTKVVPVLNEAGDKDCCEEQTVKELYVEPKPPKLLTKRVTERKCPVVCERLVEEVDPVNGAITEREHYKLDTDEPLRLVEHIGLDPSAPRAMDKGVTQSELRDALLAVVDAVKEQQPTLTTLSTGQARRLQEVVGDRVEEPKSTTWINLALAVLIAVQVGVLGYILWM